MDYSENKPIWPGSSSFSPGKTPFGFFDTDISFQTEADSFAEFAANNVGYPIMDVELIVVYCGWFVVGAQLYEDKFDNVCPTAFCQRAGH